MSKIAKQVVEIIPEMGRQDAIEFIDSRIYGAIDMAERIALMAIDGSLDNSYLSGLSSKELKEISKRNIAMLKVSQSMKKEYGDQWRQMLIDAVGTGTAVLKGLL